MNFINGAGIFIYPLGLCSFLAVFMILERWLALRTPRVIPAEVTKGLLEGKLVDTSEESVAGRIIKFYSKHQPDAKSLKAFARYEIARMERGFFILDVVVAAAPLIGLLGTVVGLIQVFSTITPGTGMPDPSGFVQGISLALTTTMLGLVIAIPALVGNSYLNRRVEMFAARLDVLLERLLEVSAK